jgi:hypothetical protein
MKVNYKLFRQSYIGKCFLSKGIAWIVRHMIDNLKHKEPKFVCETLSEKEKRYSIFSMSTIRRQEI